MPSSAPDKDAGEDRGTRHAHQYKKREIAHLLLRQEEADLLDITRRDPHQIFARRQPVESIGRKDRVAGVRDIEVGQEVGIAKNHQAVFDSLSLFAFGCDREVFNSDAYGHRTGTVGLVEGYRLATQKHAEVGLSPALVGSLDQHRGTITLGHQRPGDGEEHCEAFEALGHRMDREVLEVDRRQIVEGPGRR